MRLVEIFMDWGMDWPMAATAASMWVLTGFYLGGCLGMRIADKQIAEEQDDRY